MARASDVPKVIKSLGFLPFAKKVWAEVSTDDVFTWGSALAYAWIFAIFPFVIFMLTLAPYLPGGMKDRALNEVKNSIYTAMPGESGAQVAQSMHDVATKPAGGLLSIGLLLALWGASGGMSMTMTALDKAYYVRCTRGFFKQRGIALALTAGTAAAILLVMLLLPIGTVVLEYLSKNMHLGIVGKVLINIVRYALALGLLFGVVSMIYYFGPSIKQKYQMVTPGAIFTVVTWIVLGIAFGIYVKNFGNFNATYGALGGAIIMLLFFYINAVVLLVGAEVNSVLDFETLNVKPGATDISQANAKAEYDDKHAGEPKAKPEGAGAGDKEPIHLPIIPAPARTTRMRKVAIYGTSFLALRWVWRKAWGVRRAANSARRSNEPASHGG